MRTKFSTDGAFLITLLMTFSFSAFAQRSPVKYGDIPMEDLQMTSYDRDTSASAVVLVDYGEAYVQERTNDNVLSFSTHVRIKILNKRGLHWATTTIPLRHSGDLFEKVTGLKASAYNLENGKIVETRLTKESIFKEKVSHRYDQQKFTIPGVKEGTVIEYSYTVTSGFVTTFPNWRFQRTIPVRWSEFWAIQPDIFRYEMYMQGYLSPTNYSKKNAADNTLHHWVFQFVPAFKPEPFINCESQYLSQINFELSAIDVPGRPFRQIMGSWEMLTRILLEDESFGQVIAHSGFLKDIAKEQTVGITDPEQKVRKIHAYVKDNLEWDGTSDYLAGDLKKIMEEKKGSSGDINLILASMLDKAGIDVDMVMISTSDHGIVRMQFPISRQFNYVLCAVNINGKTLLLDATERFLPYTTLPVRCLNGQGLIVSTKRVGWIDISPTKSRTAVAANFLLQPDGELKGTLGYSRTGYDALGIRKKYQSGGEDNYIKNLVDGREWTVEKSSYVAMSDLHQPLKENYEVSIKEHATVAGDIIYINPIFVLKSESNPFLLEKRIYPVEFDHPFEKIYMLTLKIPEGYAIDEVPASQAFMLPNGAAKFAYNLGHNNGVINITSSLQINQTKFVQNEYAALREFYNKYIAKQNEQIVLRKKQ